MGRLKKREGVKQRWAEDKFTGPSKPRDPDKNSYLPRVDGMKPRKYGRCNGSIMSAAARETLAVHLERREAFFAGVASA